MVLICSQDTSLCSQTHYTAWWDWSAHSTHLTANTLHSMMELICSQHTSLCTVKHVTQHDGTHLLTAHTSLQSNTLHSMMGLICSQNTSLCSQTHYIAYWDSSAHSNNLSAVKYTTLHDETHLLTAQFCLQSSTLYSMIGLIFSQHTSLCSQIHYIAWWDSSAHRTHLSAQSNTLHSMMRLIYSQHESLCTVKHIT